MKTGFRLSAVTLGLAAPIAAYAQHGAPHIILYSLGGGFAGGLMGALLACWLCKKAWGSKGDRDLRQ